MNNSNNFARDLRNIETNMRDHVRNFRFVDPENTDAIMAWNAKMNLLQAQMRGEEDVTPLNLSAVPVKEKAAEALRVMYFFVKRENARAAKTLLRKSFILEFTPSAMRTDSDAVVRFSVYETTSTAAINVADRNPDIIIYAHTEKALAEDIVNMHGMRSEDYDNENEDGEE